MNKNQKMRKVLSILCVMVMLVAMMVVGSVVAFAEESNSVARVGETEYTSLKAAINAANTMDNANVVLLKDVTLSEKLTIKKNMTISGEHTITRGANVNLFVVNKNVTLTLDGGVVIDGGNNWTFDSESYYADLAADKKHENVLSVTYATSAEGGIEANTQLIYLNDTGATVVMNKATIQNIYASNHNNGAAFRVPSGGTLIFNDGALVQHIKGSIAGQTSGGTWIINGGEITGVHAHNTNGGMADMRGTSKLIINGGEIHHNTILGLNANGSGVIAMVLGTQAKATINDGYFHHNDSYCPGNGWGAVFYLHSGSTFEMNGGTIEDNVSTRNTALISNNSGATVSLNAGTIVIDPNNGPYAFDTQIWGTVTIKDGMKLVGEGAATFYTRLENNSTVECDIRLQGATVTGSGTFTGDVYVAANSTISGGTWNGNFTVAEGVTLTITDGIFATDVSAYLTEDKILVQLEDGTYGVAVNPAYGKEAKVNGEYYETLKEALAAANAIEGGATVTLLDDVTYTDEYLVISNVITLDLNGKTITCNGQSGLQVSGTLTLLDSSDAQTGKIIQIGDTLDTSAITLAGGNLIVKSGYIYSDHKGILLGGSGKTNTLKIEGGKIEGANVAVNFNRGYNTVEITGGELLSAKNAFHVASSKVNSVKLTIEDGVFVGAFLDIPDYAEVSILKGTFTADVSDYLADGRCLKNVDNTYVVDTHDYVAGAVVAPTFDREGYTVYTCARCGVSENRDTVVVAEVNGEYYETFKAALEAAKDSENKVVTVYQTVVIDEDMEVDLGGVRVNAANTIKNAPVFRILADVIFTNGDGIVDARGPVVGEGGINCYAFIVGNSTTRGTLTIKGGIYRGVTSAISITNGVVNIEGGTFQTGHDGEGTDYGTTYLLNCLDSAYKNGTAVYNITGGKFVGFNPENNAAEGAGTNFLTGNYKASDYYNDGKWYVAEANVEVKINGKDDIKYFADIYAALNVIQPRETATIKFLADYTFTADQRMFSNYSVIINAEYITLDLNGHTLTFDYEGSTSTCYAAFAIYNGGSLTITDTSAEQNGTIYNKSKIQGKDGPRIVWVTSAGTCTILAGNFISEQGDTMFYTSNSNKEIPTCLYIKGGYFEHTIPTSGNEYRYFNQQNGYQKQIIEISGGIFKHNPTDSEIEFAPGFSPVVNEDGFFGIVYDPAFGKEAMVNGEYYETLKEALAAANATEGGATVTLIDNVTLGEKLTVSGNVTISGEYTITRADDYTGTLFVVNSGATLTLDGGLVIDGGNAYVFDKEAYMVDAENRNKISKEDSAKWFTPEAGAPVATAYMFTTTGGTVNFNNVTVQNIYTVSYGVITAGANSTITFTGAKITHVASTQNSGVVANVSGANINVVVNEGTVIDGNHVGGNHGIFKVYSGATLTLNGGEITNNTGWNSNGVVIGIYWGSVYMNGGTICSNTGVYGPNNGRNAAIYGHSGHTFVMTGGTICHNAGGYGGLDAPYDNGKTEIYGGSIVDNVSFSGNKYPDILGNSAMQIYGGTFTQDVSQWLAPGFVLEYDEETGTYGTKERYIKSHNLLLGNTIGIYFNVDMDMFGNEVIKKNLTLVVYDEAGEKVDEIEYIKWKNGKVLFNGLAAKQMSDKFYAQVFYNGEALSEESPLVSVKDYANAILNGEYDESTKNLVKALLNYGAQAQGSMGYNTDDLANDILADDDKVVVAPNVSDESVGDNYYYGGSLNAEYNVQFNFKFFANGLDENGYAIVYFTDAEGNLVPMTTELKLVKDEKKNLLVVTYDALTIEDANLLLTCVVYNAQGEEVAKATDSIASYCARAIAGLTAMKESDKLNETTKYDDQKFKLEFYYAVMNYANAVADYSKGNK